MNAMLTPAAGTSDLNSDERGSSTWLAAVSTAITVQNVRISAGSTQRRGATAADTVGVAIGVGVVIGRCARSRSISLGGRGFGEGSIPLCHAPEVRARLGGRQRCVIRVAGSPSRVADRGLQ